MLCKLVLVLWNLGMASEGFYEMIRKTINFSLLWILEILKLSFY